MKIFLIVYQNPQTLEWYWLTFSRTRVSANDIRTLTWGTNPAIMSFVWEGFLDWEAMIEHPGDAASVVQS